MPQLNFMPTKSQMMKIEKAATQGLKGLKVLIHPKQFGGDFSLELADATLKKISKNANLGKGTAVRLTQKALKQLVGGQITPTTTIPTRPPPFIGSWDDPSERLGGFLGVDSSSQPMDFRRYRTIKSTRQAWHQANKATHGVLGLLANVASKGVTKSALGEGLGSELSNVAKNITVEQALHMMVPIINQLAATSRKKKNT